LLLTFPLCGGFDQWKLALIQILSVVARATNRTSKILASKPLVWIMRIGYVTRGIVFLIIGGFALSAAGGFPAHPQGPRDALELLFQKPFGGYLLWGLALGLMCFAVWRLLQAVLDADRHGNNLYGLMRRGVLLCSGLFYVALAASTLRVTVAERPMSEDQSAREWTGWLMAQPLGRGLVAAIAVGFVVVAIGVAVKALRAPYWRKLDATREQRVMAVVLGSCGIMARALLFLLLGGYLALAAYDSNSREAVGLAGVLIAMQHQAYGGILAGLAATGLLAFGFFEFIEGASRRADPTK
jgi:Domain of Unknown Function (DUF1206)